MRTMKSFVTHLTEVTVPIFVYDSIIVLLVYKIGETERQTYSYLHTYERDKKVRRYNTKNFHLSDPGVRLLHIPYIYVDAREVSQDEYKSV